MRRSTRAAGGALVLAFVAGGSLVVSPAAAVSSAGAVLSSPWFPVVLAGLYLVRPVLAWPITALSVVVGFRYGVVVGVPIALTGAVGTSLLPYAAARAVRTDAGWLGRATHGSERYFASTGDLRGVVAARLAPTPAEVISAAAGVGRVSLPAFVIGTAVGELPWTVAAVLAGHSLHRLSLSGAAPDPRLALAGFVVGALLLAGPAYRAVRSRVSDEPAE